MSECAVVTIETERLRLRAHRPDDLSAAQRMWSDPAVTRYMGGIIATGQQTWQRILTYAGLWSLVGFGYWAIEEKATGTFAGDVGFADFKRDIGSPRWNAPEVGWTLDAAFHGRGFATEAVRAALAWGDARSDFERTVCLIDHENAPSIRVAETCGYALFERSELRGRPTLLFERRSPARGRGEPATPSA